MFTGFKSLAGQGKMCGSGCGNDNRMNCWICKYLPKIAGGFNLRELATYAFKSFRVKVDTIPDTGVRMVGKIPDMVWSPVATTNNRNSNLFSAQ